MIYIACALVGVLVSCVAITLTAAVVLALIEVVLHIKEALRELKDE